MGGSTSGKGATTSSSAPPGQAMQSYEGLMHRANQLSNQPYNPYTGQLVANLTPQQQQAFSEYGNAYGAAQPYIDQAAAYGSLGASPIQASQIQNYLNPYQQDVIGATESQMNNIDAAQLAQTQGQGMGAGGLFNDRLGVAQGQVANQQALANNQTLAGLNVQNYSQALAAAQADRAAAAQGAYTFGNLGQENLQSILAGAGANLQAGNAQQQQQQNVLNSTYGQWQQAQAYPYQQIGWAAGIDTGLGSNMGGQSSTQPGAPNPISQYGGLALTAAGMGYNMNHDTPAFAKRGGAIRGFDAGGATPYGAGASWIPNVQITHGSGPPKPPGAPQQQAGQMPKMPGGVGKGSAGAGTAASGTSIAGEAGDALGSFGDMVGGATAAGDVGDFAALALLANKGGRVDVGRSRGLEWGHGIRGYDDGGTVVRGPQGLGERFGEFMNSHGLPGSTDLSELEAYPVGMASLGRAAFGSTPNDRVRRGFQAIQDRTVPRKGYAEGGTPYNAVPAALPGLMDEPEDPDAPRGLGSVPFGPPDPEAFSPHSLYGEPPVRGVPSSMNPDDYYPPGYDVEDTSTAPDGLHTPEDGPGAPGKPTGETLLARGDEPPQDNGTAPDGLHRPLEPLPGRQDRAEAGLGDIPHVAPPQQSRGNGIGNAMMAAGLSLMANRSPYLGPALGEAGLAGLSSYTGEQHHQEQQEHLATKEKLDQEKVDRQMKMLQEQEKRADRTAAETQRSHLANEAHQKALEEHQAALLAQGKTPPGMRMVDGKLENIPGYTDTLKEQTAAKRPPGMADEDLSIMVDSYRKGNTGVLTNIARGVSGPQNLERFWKIMGDKMREEGATGGDLAASRANFLAQSAAARSSAVRSSQIETSVEEAKNTFPLALQRSSELPRTDWVPINQMLEMWREKTSNPAQTRFVASIQAAITAYSQAMSRTGTNSVNAQQHAEKLFSTVKSHESVQALIGQLEQEMEAAKVAPEVVNRAILAHISGRSPEPVARGTGAGTPSAPAAPPAPGKYRYNPATRQLEAAAP